MKIIISLFVLAMTCSAMAQAPGGLTVKLRPSVPVVPKGASLPLTFELRNSSSADIPLEMDYMGKPGGLLRCLNEQGEDLKPEGPAVETRRTPPLGQVYYQLKPGEELSLQYDLAMLYSFRRSSAGTHTLRFTTEIGVIAEMKFNVVNYRVLNTRAVEGTYRLPVQFADTTFTPASIKLSIIQSEADGSSNWVLIDEIRTNNTVRSQLPSYAHPIPANTTIEKAEMDYLGQLWVSLRSPLGQNLLVWRLQDWTWSVLIPTTQEHISFGTTPRNRLVPNERIVIAGTEGIPKFTTQSVWAMPRSEPNPPTVSTRPATR